MNEIGFYLPDKITLDNFADVRATGEQHIATSTTEDECRFHLSGLIRFNSLTVALLVAWFRFAHNQDKSIVYMDVPHDLRNIIEVSGLTEVLPVRQTGIDGNE